MINARKLKGILILAAIMAASFSMFAHPQAASAVNPTTMNFQGKVVNANGTNVTDGTYPFTFKLYSVSSGGAAIWGETQASVSVVSGVFQVNLGSTCSLFTTQTCSTFSNTAIDFNASPALYLGITFNSDAAGEMSPRPQLQSVPYAFNADKVGGLTAAQLVQLSPGSAQTGFININGGDTLINSTGSNNTTVGGSTGTLSLGGASAGGITLQNGSTTGITIQSGKSITLTANGGSTGSVFNFGTNSLAITSSSLTVAAATGVMTLGGTTPTVTATSGVNLIVQSQGTGVLVLGTGSTGVLSLASSVTTLQRTATTGLAVDLNDGSDTTLTIKNTGAGVANLNLLDGVLQTNTVTRLDNGGNLTNIGTIGAAGGHLTVNSFADQITTFTALDGTSTTNGTSGLTSSTSLVLTSAANFDIGNYVQVNDTNCGGTGINPCYAKITAKATNTLTITPALTWTSAKTVNEFHIPELGGTDLTQTLANRYGRGYFIGGVATGNGTTYYSEDGITSSLGTFNLLNAGVTTLNIGSAATSITIGTSGTTTTFAGGIATGSSSNISAGTGALQGGSISISSGAFAVNSTGAITAATGITTSGTINGAAISGGSFSGGTVSSGTLTSSAVNSLGITANAIATASGNLTVDANSTGTVTIAGTSTGNIIFGGGSASNGCTVTRSGGIFACAGTLNGATISGGSLSATTVNGANVSGGTLSGGNVSGSTLTVSSLTFSAAGTASIAAGSTAQNISLDGSTTGQVILGGTSTGNILLGTGSGGAGGCTITRASGNFACTAGATINGATISGGTLSGGSFSGGTISSGTLTSSAVNSLGVTANAIATTSGALTIDANGANSVTLAGTSTGNIIFGTGSGGSGGCTITRVSGNFACTNTGTINGATISGGTLSGGNVSGSTLSGSALTFTAAATIQPAAATALTITGHAASTISTDSGTLTVQGGSGTVSLGTSTALTASGALAISAGGTAQTAKLDASTSGQVLIGGTSTGDILIGGGSGATGCTLTNTTGDYTCAATVNAATGYKFNGTAGQTFTCGNNTYINSAVVQGGIITGHSACTGAGLSDQRLKTNIVSLDSSILDSIKNVNTVNFDFDCTNTYFSSTDTYCDPRLQTGVIAQEIQQIFPTLVYADDSGYFHVDYQGLSVETLKAVSQLAQHIDSAGNATFNTLNVSGEAKAGSIVTPSLVSDGALVINSGSAADVSIDTGATTAYVNVGTTKAAGVNVSQAGQTTTVAGALVINQAATFHGKVNIDNTTDTDGLLSVGNFSVNGAGDVNTTGSFISKGGGLQLLDANGASMFTIDSSGNGVLAGSLNLGSASISGGLTVGGDINVAGLSTFQKLATFIAKTVFRQDVEFDGHITVAADSAGYATLRMTETTVHVTFKTAYDNPPVVSANTVDGQFVQASVSNITAQGFDLSVPAAATQDTKFSWTAIGVNDPQTASNPLPPATP